MYRSRTHDLNVNQPVKITMHLYTNKYVCYVRSGMSGLCNARIGRFVHSRCFCLAAELQANYALSTQIFNRATDLQLYIYIVLVNYGQVALFLQLRESVRGMGHIPGYCLILVYLTYAVLSNS